MVNTMKLKARIMESGYTQRKLAKEMNMGINSFNEKVNGKSPFNIEQAVQLCELCHIDSSDEKCSIFLPTASQK